MQMRLGKSLALIRWIRRYKNCYRNLIIAPKTVLLAWEQEFHKEGIEPIPLIEMTIKKRKEILDSGKQGWYLLSYAAIPYMKETILNGSFDSITCDEATCIKNPGAKVTKILLKAAKNVRVRACLSGEPAPEDWSNIWTQMAFVNGGTWMGHSNYYTWEKEHFLFFGFTRVLPTTNLVKIKAKFHEDAHVVTRNQAGIKDEKIYQTLADSLDDDTKKVYDSIEKTWQLPTDVAPSVEDMTKHSIVVVTWLRRITGGFLPRNDGTLEQIPCWKYDEIQKIINNTTRSIVVWCAFNAEIERLSNLFKTWRISSRTITGDVVQAERREIINSFQQDKFKVLLLQTKCGQYGLDLSSADTSVYFSNHYSYELRAQSEERIFMPGKTRDLLIIDLMSKGTIDEEVRETLRSKKSDARLLLSRIKLARFGHDN